MKFLYRKYAAKKGEVIEVAPSAPSTVKFMTAAEFRKYSGGKTHTYYKGRNINDRIRISLPFDSVWHAVVEMKDGVVTATSKLCPPSPETDRWDLAERDDLAALAEAELKTMSQGTRSEG